MKRERPAEANTDRLFVVLMGPRRGQPLREDGLDEIIRGARGRAGLAHIGCHGLRHTCLTRLREAGMALEAVQAQAGHRSIESTRLYLHLTNDWLAAEYHLAAQLIDATRRAPRRWPDDRGRCHHCHVVGVGVVLTAGVAEIAGVAPTLAATATAYLDKRSPCRCDRAAWRWPTPTCACSAAGPEHGHEQFGLRRPARRCARRRSRCDDPGS